MKAQIEKRTKSDKIKEAYKSSEEYVNEKLTIRSMLLMIIVPVIIKLLEAISLLVFIVPFQEQGTVYVNLTFLAVFFFALLIALYGFHEWKLRLDLKAKTTIETNSLSVQLKVVSDELSQTIHDKSKEGIMSTAVLIDSITQPEEIKREMDELLKTIDYSPNGVDKVDIDITRNALKVIEEQLAKQEQLELDNLTKDLPQDPEVEEFKYSNIEPTGSNTEQTAVGKITATRIVDPNITVVKIAIKEVEANREAELEKQLAAVKDPEPEKEEEPIKEEEKDDRPIHVDTEGNKYRINETDGKWEFL